jgi:cation diffusion facilitator family transporter
MRRGRPPGRVGDGDPRSRTVRAERFRAVRRSLLVVLAVDVLLSAGKGVYGYVTGSLGMVSDGLHSAVHAAGSVIALVGVRLASRPADAHHPYGYERYEPLAAVGIAALMFFAVWRILAGALGRFRDPVVPEATLPSFGIMAAAIVGTFALARWEGRRGRALSSVILEADSGRVRGDTLVSACVIAALVASRVGWAWVDPVVSLAVAALIGRTAWRSVRSASQALTDTAMAETEAIAQAALSIHGVRGCHQVRARGAGGAVRVDLHVVVDPQMTVAESHALVRAIERRVREQLPGVVEVLVHVGVAPVHDGRGEQRRPGAS